jgi:uncharacterized membrane protein
MDEPVNIQRTSLKKIGGYLHRVTPIVDASGKILNYALRPIMVEFTLRDVVQVCVGSALLAVPVSFTEEAWKLAETLPNIHIIGLASLSLLLIALFIYFNFYRVDLKGNEIRFIKRTIGTYLISMLMVTVILSLIDKCPWNVDPWLAVKRVIIVAFPAAMSGTVSDALK